MRCVPSVACLIAVFASGAAAQPFGVPLEEGVVVELGANRLVTPAFESLGPEGVAWRAEVRHPGADFIRIELAEIVDASASDYRVLLRDQSLAQVVVYAKADFAAKPSFWSPLIPGSTAIVEVVADAPPSGLVFAVPRMVYQTREPVPLSVIGGDQREKLWRVAEPDVQKVATSVAKLIYLKEGSSYACTAFLVGADLMLTNEHCVASQSVCDTALALFGFEEQSDGTVAHGEQIACKAHLGSQFERDYSLLRLERAAAAEPLALCGRAVAPAEALLVVQHPAGEVKQISREACAVGQASVRGRRRSAGSVDFTHGCDTLKGSSGSPVFDAQRRVVGLHHMGFGSPPFDEINRAVKIGEVLPLIPGVVERCETD